MHAENIFMRKFVIDTNIWIYLVENKIDIFSQLKGEKIYTLSSVINELKNISKKKNKSGIAAKIALEMIKKFNVEILEIHGSSDEALLNLAKKGYVIITQDTELMRKIKETRGKAFGIKQGKYIEIH